MHVRSQGQEITILIRKKVWATEFYEELMVKIKKWSM
jgi:hypothetical protein